MGFWDTGITDLGAMGVNVTQAQRLTLEQGGEVLTIRGLLSPWWSQGDSSPMCDQEGEVVYVPATLSACEPYARMRPDWSRDHAIVREFMDTEYGSDWRTWPSYVGELDEAIEQRWWNDTLTYVRVWDGIPIMNDMDADAVKRIYRAAQNRLNNSVYYELVDLYEFENSGEYSIDDILPLVDLYKEENKEAFDEMVEDITDLDPDYVHRIVAAVKSLTEGNYVYFGPAAPDHRVMKDCEFASMDHYLVGDYEALAMWRRLVSRRENALNIIGNGLGNTKALLFDNHERST